MTIKLDGKELSFKLRENLKKRVIKLKKQGIVPCLAVILVGNDPASQIYIKSKKKVALKLGIKTLDEVLPANISQARVIRLIHKLNHDPHVHGILIQLPLPSTLNEQQVIQAIDPTKDVDGFHPENLGKLFVNEGDLIPCTARGIMTLLTSYHIDLESKSVLIIGRSRIVGIPMTALMINKDATVTIAHSYTSNLKCLTRNADIIIVAVGKAKFLKGKDFNQKAVVVDVGTNRTLTGKLVGDVDEQTTNGKVAYLSPVPGGVGPMTITMLMTQTVEIAERSVHNDSK